MNNYQALNRIKAKSEGFSSFFINSLYVSFFITITSKIYIPLHPVPVYLGNLAIMTCSLIYSPSVAVSGVLLHIFYLLIGLPVGASCYDAGLSVFFGPTAGYLVSFPIVSLFISFCKYLLNPFSYYKQLTVLFIGNAITFAFGTGYLTYLFGAYNAVIYGIVPFIVSDFIFKPIAAIYLADFINKKY